MKPNPAHRLPAPLEAAVQRVKLAARGAAERTIESLGLAALASNNVFARDGLLGAQFELNRKSAVFALTFNDALDERIIREVTPRGTATTRDATAPAHTTAAGLAAWDALTLVEDHEVEVQISAERFGLEITHVCEWELRELDAYVASLLGDVGSDQERNPLRPEIVGHAMIRGLEAVSERPEIRKVLATEIGRSLGGMLRATYAEIVAELRGAGVQPMGLSVRMQGGSRNAGTAGGGTGDTHSGPGDLRSAFGHSGSGHGLHTASGYDSRYGTARAGSGSRAAAFGPSTRSGSAGARRGTPLGQVDPALMSLLRRLAYNDIADGHGDFGAVSGTGHGLHGDALPNLIHAHRDELRQAAGGSLDHMVIDVIGSLFEQILSDPKVPPQMARQIARLQLPVLRAALGDPSFFSSRRHPVRRFVNRIASLGASFEDFSDPAAQRFLVRVRALVQDVVEGDFDQIELYEQKLGELEAFTADAAREEGRAQGSAAELLVAKEDELRLRALYAQRLDGDLKGLAAPSFVRDFVSRVWSQVLLRAAERDGPESPRLQRLRAAGRDLFMSVQPKSSPALRKSFLAELPKMMQELTEGMDLIGWPEARRRAFFGLLMPAHAEALKAPGLRPLDINLMARQVDGALDRAPPSREEVRAAPASLPVLTDEIGNMPFTAAEAERVGLVDEASVDWSGTVDIDLGEAEPLPAQGLPGAPAAPGLPLPAASAMEPPEPTHGKSLADHVQIGFAYQMHLEGDWQKVRLSHVSPARSFFVFTRGRKHKQAVSLTQRMLVKLCETGRLRAFENAYLIERATARARRQLAQA